MDDARKDYLKAVGALSTASLLWSASFIAMKIAMEAFTPMFIIFMRMFLGSLFLLWLLRRQGGVRPFKADLAPILFMALCEPCLYFVFEANALVHTQAAQAGMITALLPLMTAAAAALVLKERMGGRGLFGLVLAVIGVVVMSLAAEPGADAPNPLLGNFLEFLAMVCAVGYIVLARKLSARHSPLFLTAMQSFTGLIFFTPVLFFSPPPQSFPLAPTLSLVFLAIGVTCLALVCYNYGVSKVEASKASVFINLIPVFTLGLSWLVLDERLGAVQYAGAVAVFLGVFLSAAPFGNPEASG